MPDLSILSHAAHASHASHNQGDYFMGSRYGLVSAFHRTILW
jgi:hypothetical protein